MDDVVIIHEDNIPRQRWNLGRVEELLPGNDGEVRAVKLQTSSGNFITRPLYKLYPLESANSTREGTSDQPVAEETMRSSGEPNSGIEETKEDTDTDDDEVANPILEEVPRREASVRAELKMKYGQK